MILFRYLLNRYPSILPLLILLTSMAAFSQAGKETSETANPQPDSTMAASPLTAPIDQKLMTTIDWLQLLERIPTAITYEEAKRLFPNIGELQTEGGGVFDPKYGLYEAFLPIKIFNLPARIEFNFRCENQSKCHLYTFYFQIWNIDSLTAVTIYERLREYYTDLYGPCRVEHDEVEYYLNESCSRTVGKRKYHLVMCIYFRDDAYVGWGL